MKPITWRHNAWENDDNLGQNITGGDYDSDWHRLDGLHPVTVTVEGTFEADVFILFSNNDTPPDGVIDFAIARQIKQPDSFTIDAPFRCIKAVVRNWVSGTVRSIDWYLRDRGAQN